MSLFATTQRIVLPLLILGVAITGFVLLRSTRPEAAPVAVAEKAWRVSVQTINPGLYAPTLLLYGVVEAPQRAGLSAALTADVLQVLTAEGLSVKAEDTLIVLDSRDAELALRQRQADVAEMTAMIESERKRHQRDLVALEKM